MDSAAPQLLNEREAAKILAVSIAAMRRWRRERRGPRFIRCERCIRYTIADLVAFVETNSSEVKKAPDSQSAAEREVRDAGATTQTT
jgi:hypothetical protein